MHEVAGAHGLERRSEEEILEALYKDVYREGMFIKEFMWRADRYGAAVGMQQDLAEALELESVDDITDETIESLPMFLPFAMPGSGETRVMAVRDAYEKLRDQREKDAPVASGERTLGSVHGSFTIGEVVVTAYLPDHAPDVWTVTIARDGAVYATEMLPMDYAPVFGPDVSDVAALNEFVETLVKKYELE